tara:strand:+ start:141 stop:836 length:696 start_codon:yes stop_codon:yes gene_type:complete
MRQKSRDNFFEAVYDKLSMPLAAFFIKRNFTPNQITILSGLFGIATCFLIAFNSKNNRLLAFIFIQLFATLDLVDGFLARKKGITSKFGQWLDIFFDKLIEVSLLASIAYTSYVKHENIDSIIIGSTLIIFHLLIQYLMIINQLHFQKEKKNTSSKILQKARNKAFSPRSLIINIIRFIELHLTLKHSTLLLVSSFFVLTNQHFIGLCALLVISFYTLLLMCFYNFFLIKD